MTKQPEQKSRDVKVEHQKSLEQALTNPTSLACLLACMPDVGIDSDFERNQDMDVVADGHRFNCDAWI